MITVGAMRLPQPEPLDDLSAFLRGLEPDGGYWLAMRRLADHDHSGGVMGVPVAGAGGGTGADVTLTGTEGVTVVEAPANTFALGLTASPDANNTVQIRANGIYSASGAIPPEYVTDAELATALGPYATDADLAAHAAAADPHAVYTTAAELTTALTPYLTSATATTTYVPLAGGSVLAGLLGPSTTNTRDLGTTALRWRKLWAVDVETTNVPTIGGVSMDSRYQAAGTYLTQAAGDLRYEPIDTMYTKAESDTKYALATALTALTTRVAALETSVAALKTHGHRLGTFTGVQSPDPVIP